jgi:hypothetical protein
MGEGREGRCVRIVGESRRPCQSPTDGDVLYFRATSQYRIPTMADARYAADSLTAFAQALLERSGVRADIAKDVAEILVAGDLLGHRTHGLALLAGYLGEIEKGTMLKPESRRSSARAAAQAWDGRRLPGPGSRCARSTPRWRWPPRTARAP